MDLKHWGWPCSGPCPHLNQKLIFTIRIDDFSLNVWWQNWNTYHSFFPLSIEAPISLSLFREFSVQQDFTQCDKTLIWMFEVTERFENQEIKHSKHVTGRHKVYLVKFVLPLFYLLKRIFLFLLIAETEENMNLTFPTWFKLQNKLHHIPPEQDLSFESCNCTLALDKNPKFKTRVEYSY